MTRRETLLLNRRLRAAGYDTSRPDELPFTLEAVRAKAEHRYCRGLSPAAAYALAMCVAIPASAIEAR